MFRELLKAVHLLFGLHGHQLAVQILRHCEGLRDIAERRPWKGRASNPTHATWGGASRMALGLGEGEGEARAGRRKLAAWGWAYSGLAESGAGILNHCPSCFHLTYPPPGVSASHPGLSISP